MDALASAVHEGKGALAAVKADLERERIEGDAAVDAELERLAPSWRGSTARPARTS